MNGNGLNYANRYIGIDPGKTGAMAVFRGGSLQYVFDTPLIKVKGKKSAFCIEEMASFLNHERNYARSHGGEVIAVIEQQHAFPRQGGVGNFTAGLGYGIWLGLFRGLQIRYLEVTSMKWRKAIFSESESQFIASQSKSHSEANKMRKQQSIIRARKVSGAAKFLKRKKDDGRAEAVLIGLASRMMHANEKASLNRRKDETSLG